MGSNNRVLVFVLAGVAVAIVMLLMVVAVAGLFLVRSSDDGGVSALPPVEDSGGEPQRPSSSPTTSTVPETMTTLSEVAQAEAEIRQLVTDWALAPFDTSKGEEELGLEYLTGLVERRVREFAQEVTDEGKITRDRGPGRIEITEVVVFLDEGRGEVQFCAGTTSETVDAETGEVLETDDPNAPTMNEILVELTPEGWKIYELYASRLLPEPEPCEISGEGQ